MKSSYDVAKELIRIGETEGLEGTLSQLLLFKQITQAQYTELITMIKKNV